MKTLTPAETLKLAYDYISLDRTLISGEETLALAREVARLHEAAARPEVGAPTPKNVTEAFERWMDATYPDWCKVEMRFHSGALYDAYRAALSPQKE